MRSSNAGALIIVIGVLGGCSPPQPTATQSSGVSSPDCAGGAASAQDAQAITTLSRSIEKGPLYSIAARGGLVGCRASRDDTAITLEYTFRDGALMRVTRNDATEYTDQEVRLTAPLGEPAVAALTRAEQAAFDGKGCGIDWRSVDTREPRDEPGTTERIYRGEVCNCQARARSDGSGRVLRLQLRSAC